MPRPRIRRLTFVLALLLGVLALAWTLGPGPRRSVPVDLTLAAHTGRWQVAQQLAAAGVIRTPFGFALWSLAHPGVTLKAGPYRFPGGESVPAVFQMLAAGRFFAVTLTIPEGYNRFDIARLVERRNLASAADFLRLTAGPALVRDLDPQAVSLEGYLFPATYQFAPGAGAAAIVARMVDRFRQELRSEPNHPSGLHDWVTLASLVERESALASERTLIAGVFENRLARGMPLQCDPTVVYAALLAGRYTGAIHRADLAFNSPYNTYLHPGLPPGPIANPGRQALEAAAQPAPTPFLYFVSNGNGAHRFARTLAQQQRNVQLYLKALHDAHGPGR